MHESNARLARNGWADLKTSFRRISGSICAPRGFKCAAVFCDIKKLGTGKGSEKSRKGDLALIVSDVPAAVAGMFTSNQVCAAPVKISRQRAKRKSARAIVVNSGNANACTGAQGLKDARHMSQLAAKALSLNENDVLVCSTGRIGVPMPMQNVERGIRNCAPRVARSTSNARQVAEGIMTTDTRRKEIAVDFKSGKGTIRIGGICKGAGMIQPGMATMLAFITTDAAIESAALGRALKIAVEQSFNRITVDGDMSTNDSVIALANGLAGNSKSHIRAPQFQAALNFVCL
jgi:glutamate N-acetyltransferase/amino-acid N-acetyltransferase